MSERLLQCLTLLVKMTRECDMILEFLQTVGMPYGATAIFNYLNTCQHSYKNSVRINESTFPPGYHWYIR